MRRCRASGARRRSPDRDAALPRVPASKDSSSHAYCRAFIAGYFGGYVVSTGVSTLKQFCPPPGVTTEQIVKKVEPFLKPRRGQLEDELAEGALESALLAAYSCKKPTAGERRH